MDIQQFSQLLNSAPDSDALGFKDQFASLMRTLDTRSVIAQQLRNCLLDYRAPPPIVYESTVQLVNGSWFSIDLTINHAKSLPSVVHTHSDSVAYFLTPAHYQRFALKDFDKSSFTMDSRILPTDTGAFQPDDVVAIDSRREIICLWADKPMAYVSLSNKFDQGITWRFDTASGKPLSHFNSSATTTVLEMISKFLGLYGGEDSIEPLKTLLSHSSESVRWEAANALAHIDSNEGLQAFQQLAQCSTPNLARVAMQTIESNEVPV